MIMPEGKVKGEPRVKKKLSAWESNPARARVVLIVDIMTSANVTNTPAKMLDDQIVKYKIYTVIHFV